MEKYKLIIYSSMIIRKFLSFTGFDVHLCFKHAQPKMCRSPKVENGVDNLFSLIRPHWADGADSVIVAMSVFPCAPSGAFFFIASHWTSVHMISSRPLIGPPSRPPQG